MAFKANEVLPGVWHIQDCMGVCMTLLTGSEYALLVDTGYGLEDVGAFVRTITKLPFLTLLTHHHHDHALGARWLQDTFMFDEDAADWWTYVGRAQRERVLEQAKAKGLSAEEDFLDAGCCPMPLSIEALLHTRPAKDGHIDLGGLTVEVIHCPGHTPGSAVVWVPERKLLLTGDDWNPCTWLFFPAALPVHDYLRNARKLLALPFEHVLCSHQPTLFPRAKLESFLNGMTDDVLRAAKAVKPGPYPEIDTRQAELPDGQVLVFDWAKANL